ncbi:MAG: mechanosensitive ion channel family protein [Oceanipulchritudo sp.]
MSEDIERLEAIYNTLIELGIRYGFQVLGALVVLVLGVLLARFTGKLVFRISGKANLDVTLSKFFSGVVKVVIIAFALIIAMAKFGITIAPMVAAIGAGAFGLSLAIQGPVANYGAGLALILTRPFKVGNTLTLHGLTGIVEEIKLGATILSTEDGEQITIPNRKVIGEIFVNSFPYKIVEGSIGIAYSADPEKAVSLIRECLGQSDHVARDPSPQIGIESFGDSSLKIGYRYWVKTQVYYQTQYKINLAVFSAFRRNGVAIPFPQREVRLLNASSGS